MHCDYRRRFLQLLAGSPLLRGQAGVIASPAEALNVMDFEAVAKKLLPPVHFGYMATGVDDDVTLRANVAGYQRLYLRPRRLVNLSMEYVVRRNTSVYVTISNLLNNPVAIVNLDNVKSVKPHTNGECFLVLGSGTQVKVSRSYRDVVARFL